ncbi:LytTR family DNA-binding domain-containing protein [Proteinivorax tanatarense]|uniref:Stage 0 sporulation protein A homolog n=1 Tax=Proteinivorax tanatarense TaxID=1260629 RepID=A0AAU7VPZ0_9FIRM
MFSVGICDDEISICDEIERSINKYIEMNNVDIKVEKFTSGKELYIEIKKGAKFDLIYLDIEMKQMDGIMLGERIRNEMDDYITKITYISGKNGYECRLFDVQPLHFLKKPLEEDKIIDSLKLALKLTDYFGGFFSFKKGHELYKLSLKEIIYFESVNREIKIVTSSGKKHYYYGTMEEVFSRVIKHQFIRIHRSYIINYHHASKLKYEKVVMSNREELPISQSRRKEVRQLQLDFEKENYHWS